MSGEPLSVSVIFQGNKIVRKTPIIMASNNYVFPDDPSFTCRIVTFEWRYAPLLNKYIKAMMHPAAIGSILCYINMAITKCVDYKVVDKGTCKFIQSNIYNMCDKE